MSSTNFMSCSMTRTERFLMNAVEQFARLDPFADAHAATGFVQHQQVRILD